MHSCLIWHRSNQCSLASSALDLRTRPARSTVSLPGSAFADNSCPFSLINVIPQSPPEHGLFNFPLAHLILNLPQAYSGVTKGAGNISTPPEIYLSMMTDLVVAPQCIAPHSYVAIADSHKRRNLAKVYSWFYDYDDATIECSKQQRAPIILVIRCGNPLEADDAKEGNRGKRDSQIVLLDSCRRWCMMRRLTIFPFWAWHIWESKADNAVQYRNDVPLAVFSLIITMSKACRSPQVEWR